MAFCEGDVREKPHLAETVTKMPRTSRPRMAYVAFGAWKQGPETRCMS